MRHRDRRRHHVSLNGRKELKRHHPGADHPDRDHQGRHTQGERHITPAKPEVQARLVGVADEPLQRAGHAALESMPGARPLRRWLHVRQVRRQNPERLDQREQETRDHDQRNGPHDLAHRAGHRQQRSKRGDRREHGKHHRHGDLARALNRTREAVSVSTLMGVHVLTDDDRVIHHDAEHQDEREQGNHVQRHVQTREHPQRAKERDRDTQAHPESQAELDEERQHEKDERKSRGSVAQQQTHAIRQDAGLVLPDGE